MKKVSFICVLAILVLVIFGFGCSSENEKADVSKSAPKVEAQAPEPVKPVTAPAPQKVDAGLSGEVLVLQPALWKAPTKPPVKFTHEKHAKTHGISCSDCHHVIADGKNVWTQDMPVAKCESCHNESTVKGEKKLPDEEKRKNLKLAFHGNCRTCHKQVKKENAETTAPVSCNQCHKK